MNRDSPYSSAMTRIGFLVPPGNPTVEPEMIRLAPKGVTVHFTRMVAHGEAGSHRGQDERNRSQIAHLDENVALLAMVKPAVIALAHTAMSATLGKEGERELVERLGRSSGIPFITAFGSVLLALVSFGARRIALATPYGADTTLQTKAHLEAHGVSVVSFGSLDNVKNIYEETPERAYALARRVDAPDAEARSEEHTSELQSRFGISYAVFCLKKKKSSVKTAHAALRRAAAACLGAGARD